MRAVYQYFSDLADTLTKLILQVIEIGQSSASTVALLIPRSVFLTQLIHELYMRSVRSSTCSCNALELLSPNMD